MLDKETKKRINNCRAILVGKLPDPKAQIEQITIGLIYKFMDDMDKESIDLGGKAKFFSDNYARYSWDCLFDSKVSASEMFDLYSDAIVSMEKNPNIPDLFRNIFKNAFLPYRDPETLKMFLKTIAEFEYSHSEKLGDAYEYLLSVMGSQGDAGQFRTPRHIIDFLVKCVDPAKTDTILDPACGTAGFLISAFKYIHDKNKKGLTPDEQKKLIENFIGYDISPDMVRLSLVNMYLHGFSDPHISEYDTLTSEDRWNESFDVILANPPFMSPKGGIRPHKKFTISSNRSEVLFVDFITEHLNPKGRAGIIVPEGVIFQSGKAYKDLRKMLVDKYIYAVVSLPAGVFNPYSGVKTSILLVDKDFAKKSNEILFVKIDNDGYGLGSQRNAIKGGQLEEAIELLQNFKSGDFSKNTMAHAVSKKEIAKDGDYNLSGERFRKVVLSNTIYEFLPCGDLVRVNVKSFNPALNPEDKYELWSIPAFDNGRPEITFGSEIGSSKKVVLQNDVLLSRIVPHIRRSWVVNENDSSLMKLASTEWIVFNNPKITPYYLKRILTSDTFHRQFMSTVTGVGGSLSRANPKAVGEILIPLPPLSIQEEIVVEIEGYQKIIDGAKAVVENYKPKIDIDPDWEVVELGEHCKIRGGNAFKSSDYVDDGVQLIRMGNVKPMFFDFTNSPSYLPLDYLGSYPKYIISRGDLLVSMTGTIGKEDYGNVCQIEQSDRFLLNQRVGKFELLTELLDRQFLYYLANSDNFRKQLFANSSGGVRQSNISNKGIESILIPFPPIEKQHEIVAQIENEETLVKSNKELIIIFEQKIKNRIAKVWGD